MAFDLKSAIASIAPTLGTMLLGPLGGTAITALESAFGLSPGAGQDGITQVMQTGAMTPDIIANVRAADQKHQEILAQQKKMNADYNLAMVQADVADRQGARTLQTSTKSVVVPTLAFVIVGAFVVMTASTLAGYSHVEGALAGTLVGYLSAKCEQVLAFYFGSSKSSQNKDEMLYNSTPTNQGDNK